MLGKAQIMEISFREMLSKAKIAKINSHEMLGKAQIEKISSCEMSGKIANINPCDQGAREASWIFVN